MTGDRIEICVRSPLLTIESVQNLRAKIGMQRKRAKLLQSLVIFAIALTILTSGIGLIHNYSLSEAEYTEQEEETAKYIYTDDYKYDEPISDKLEIRSLTPEETEAARAELESRGEQLRKVCATFDKTDVNLEDVLSNMIIDTKHKVSWCPIYKAASSTWMQYFAVLGGVLTRTGLDLIRRNLIQINALVRQAFPRERNVTEAYQRVNRTKTFLVVRDPMERLVSAYRDKLERIQGREYYYKRFGRHITRKYRRHSNSNQTRLEPTFQEFLRYIVEEKYFDEHWAPYFDSCAPCSIRYDYILRFDTLRRDKNFLIQELDLRPYLYLRYNLGDPSTEGIATNNDTVNEYIKDIPRTLLDEIYRIYQKDFQLFSYPFL